MEQNNKRGMSAGGLLITIALIGIVTSIVMSSLSDARDASTSTYTPPPTPVSTFELGTYKVESEEFQYMEQSEVNLWQSFSNRKKVGAVSEGAVLEVISHDAQNDYCKVTAGEQTGWLACGWLVKQ